MATRTSVTQTGVTRTRDDALGTEAHGRDGGAAPGEGGRPIGLVAALSWEVRPLLRRQSGAGRVEKDGPVYSFLARETPVHLTVAGVGAENAYRAARRLLDRYRVRGLVTIGFAGGLADSLNAGDIVLADHVTDQRTGERFDCSGELSLNGLGPIEHAHRGGLLSVMEVVTAAAEKRKLAGKWGAVAVDMESAGVGRAASESGVAFAAVKAITDTAMQSISFDFARCRSEHNGLSFWKIAREGMRTSQAIRDVWMLAKGARIAARALAEALGSAELRGTR